MLKKIIGLQDMEYVNAIAKELSLIGNDDGELGFRCAGSTGEWHASDRIAEEMEYIGLQNVTVNTFPVFAWEPLSGNLKVDGIDIPAVSFAGTTGTPDEGITAQIEYVGRGALADYEGKDVRGKIVFCTFDMLEDYWVNLPAYQAIQKGAVAFVCSYAGDAYAHHEGALANMNGQLKGGFPVCNISRKDGDALRKMLERTPVTATLKLKVKTDEMGKSSNVIGYIPGRDPSKMIVLAGHMDGFFNTYQDDVLAIGINLDIARSIIKSGHVPEHTIALVAHGSEEYGAGGSRYDWCTGSWYNTTEHNPKWFGKAVAFLNIDAVRPDTPVYNIACTQEWRSFMNSFMNDMEKPPELVWPGGAAITPPKGPMADGYVYSLMGVPELMIGGGPSEWSRLNYHTQFDNCSIYEEEKDLIKYLTASYTSILMAMDKLALPPLDFSCVAEDVLATIDRIPEGEFSLEVQELVNAARNLISTGKSVYEEICRVNEASCCDSEMLAENRLKLLECYRIVHRDLTKLTFDDCENYQHEEMGTDIRSIDNALASLENKDIQQAIKELWTLDLFRFAYEFDEATYRFITGIQDYRRDDLFWATGKIHKYVDASKLVKALKDNNIVLATEELKLLRAEACDTMRETLAEETRIIREIETKAKEIQWKKKTK